MREKWARRIALLTSLLILVLAVIFSLIQNPAMTPDVTGKSVKMPSVNLQVPGVVSPEGIEAGRQVYKQQACARCHSIAGKGNSRNPLDGVGVRRTADELRNWIIGADTIQGSVPEGVFKLKKTYRGLTERDLDSLVIYMQSLQP
ncbi:MAG: cytochrome c [Gammaproteobacteria bacterium]|nr:cytochrome c [Gammaproteobacteria bacterium]